MLCEPTKQNKIRLERSSGLGVPTKLPSPSPSLPKSREWACAAFRAALLLLAWLYFLEHRMTLCDPMDYSSPWNSLGQNTGVGCHALLQGLFPTQGSNPGLLHCRRILGAQGGSLISLPCGGRDGRGRPCSSGFPQLLSHPAPPSLCSRSAVLSRAAS